MYRQWAESCPPARSVTSVYGRPTIWNGHFGKRSNEWSCQTSEKSASSPICRLPSVVLGLVGRVQLVPDVIGNVAYLGA